MQINIPEDKKQLLKNIGITRQDFSHYKAGRKNKISKLHLKMIELVIENKIVSSGEFIPLNKKNEWKLKGKKIIVLRGFINDLSKLRNRL